MVCSTVVLSIFPAIAFYAIEPVAIGIIIRTAITSTIAKYLKIYEKSSDNVIRLLSKDFENVWRYLGIKNPIATTWLISQDTKLA
jgi:hypothetical protein